MGMLLPKIHLFFTKFTSGSVFDIYYPMTYIFAIPIVELILLYFPCFAIDTAKLVVITLKTSAVVHQESLSMHT